MVRIWAMCRGPEDLAARRRWRALQRIDKAFTWDNPLSAHGLMHMVISNAHAGDPYKHRHAVHVHGQHGLELVDEHSAVMDMLTDTDENGEYVIPRIIYSDAYSSEMVAFADLILPDTTYLERHDCISLLDRPISEPEAAADSIRWPVVEPDRDVRGFQTCCLIWVHG
jgi:anaerobic selenocysteine-containing dehydrogenase